MILYIDIDCVLQDYNTDNYVKGAMNLFSICQGSLQFVYNQYYNYGNTY